MSTLRESLTTGSDYNAATYDNAWAAQTFKHAAAFECTNIRLLMARYPNTGADDAAYCAIFAVDGADKPTGSPLSNWANLPYTAFTVHDTYSWVEFIFTTKPYLLANTRYAIVLKGGTGTSQRWFGHRIDTTDGEYVVGDLLRGQYWTSPDAGVTWSDVSHGSDADAMFEVWGGDPYAPTVTTQAVTDITDVSATGNGNITSLGAPAATQHGHCWALTANPTIVDSKTENGVPAAIGAFTSSITGLTQRTLYHTRAYATNSVGTAYGADVEFTTYAVYPTEAITRVTGLVHRYDRDAGTYQLEVWLGQVTAEDDIRAAMTIPISVLPGKSVEEIVRDILRRRGYGHPAVLEEPTTYVAKYPTKPAAKPAPEMQPEPPWEQWFRKWIVPAPPMPAPKPLNWLERWMLKYLPIKGPKK